MFEKVTAALALARTEVNNAIAGARKTLANEKSPINETLTASRALHVGGRIDTTLAKAESRIAGAVKKLQPREKKAKAKKAKA